MRSILNDAVARKEQDTRWAVGEHWMERFAGYVRISGMRQVRFRIEWIGSSIVAARSRHLTGLFG